MKPMPLNPGRCVVCSKPPFIAALERFLSAKQKTFFGVPQDRKVVYNLCEAHQSECFGKGHESEFPQGPLLADAIQNAIENYDFAGEDRYDSDLRKETIEQLSLGKQLLANNAFDEALSVLLGAVNRHESHFGRAANLEIVEGFFALADCYTAKNNLPKAREFYKKTMALWETAEGLDSPKLGELLYKVAMSYISEKSFVVAEPVLKRCLAIVENSKKRSSIEKNAVLNALAQVCAALNRLDESKKWISLCSGLKLQASK